ncbi:bifunctional DNA primase/polymerase [Cryobacterium mannosilyticum]|uniref:DNA primase/polymerase bifunctional N-terminal domain-containing protein n=1 Tax=Cryobacterium mannosilyticum TaxID=1259190 RepID=A0A4R8WFR2_9MICO|nr:bifunctional DNA primase/polymerase [Cryobacterium mannosilyticum]TFC06752.1 hypothetical protein E3O32_03305 [Cryobacterium mannosilyticum]
MPVDAVDAVVTLDNLEAWVAAGWSIFPCHSIRDGACSCGKSDCGSPGKHPRTFNGVKGASKDIEVVLGWTRKFPACNWGMATGEPSGVVVFDIDVKKTNGFESFDALLVEAGITAPESFTVATGGGGRHIFFKAPDRHIRNRVNFRPGIDVRGDGGYVLLPGSNHISGRTYVLEQSTVLANLPDKLLSLLDSGTSTSNASTIADLTVDQFIEGVEEGERDDKLFKMACKLRRQMGDQRAAITLLVLTAAANSNPPFLEKDALRKIDQAFAQDHSDLIDLDNMPFAAINGELPDFLEDADPAFIRDVAKGVRAAEVRDSVARVRREKRIAKYGDAAAVDGFEFMFGEIAEDVPVWGDGDDLLWTEGGGLMIPSDQGLGKSFTAQQITLGRLGLGPGNLLGLTLHRLAEDKIIVYLALDRPRQIARSMARLFKTEAERAIARQRLRIWTKPVPVDVLGDTHAFADWLQDTFGSNIGDVIVDSVKDLTPANLSNGEVGQALDMAWKECRARGMSTLLLHHERKTGNDDSRANRLPSLDNIYGSVWLTSGMDSVLHIQGKQGANIVTYTHLKPIIELVDPIDAMHDQDKGRTHVIELTKKQGGPSADKVEQVFAFVANRSAGGEVVTAADVEAATGHAPASVRRYINTLLVKERIEEASPYVKATATPATYRAKP